MMSALQSFRHLFIHCILSTCVIITQLTGARTRFVHFFAADININTPGKPVKKRPTMLINIVASHWLETDCGLCNCDRTDLNRNGQVDNYDLKMLCNNWLVVN